MSTCWWCGFPVRLRCSARLPNAARDDFLLTFGDLSVSVRAGRVMLWSPPIVVSLIKHVASWALQCSSRVHVKAYLCPIVSPSTMVLPWSAMWSAFQVGRLSRVSVYVFDTDDANRTMTSCTGPTTVRRHQTHPGTSMLCLAIPRWHQKHRVQAHRHNDNTCTCRVQFGWKCQRRLSSCESRARNQRCVVSSRSSAANMCKSWWKCPRTCTMRPQCRRKISMAACTMHAAVLRVSHHVIVA